MKKAKVTKTKEANTPKTIQNDTINQLKSFFNSEIALSTKNQNLSQINAFIDTFQNNEAYTYHFEVINGFVNENLPAPFVISKVAKYIATIK